LQAFSVSGRRIEAPEPDPNEPDELSFLAGRHGDEAAEVGRAVSGEDVAFDTDLRGRRDRDDGLQRSWYESGVMVPLVPSVPSLPFVPLVPLVPARPTSSWEPDLSEKEASWPR
jgi:hypothetical protein